MSKKKSKIEKELYTFNGSMDAIFENYKPIKLKEKKRLIKKLKKESKKLADEFFKSNEFGAYNSFLAKNNAVKNLERTDGKITINYGGKSFSVNVNPQWFSRIKDKEKYLDKQFKRKLTTILNKQKAPTTDKEARQLEGLISLYNTKLGGKDYFDSAVISNNINKLTNYRSKLNDYNYSDYIFKIKNHIEYLDSQKEIQKLYLLLDNSSLTDDEIDSILKQISLLEDFSEEEEGEEEEEAPKGTSGQGLPIEIEKEIEGNLIEIDVNFI